MSEVGEAVVYNYEKGQWGVWTDIPLVDACISEGKLVLLQDDWEVWRQSDSAYTHPNSPAGNNLIKIQTPWINLGEIQKNKKFRFIHVLGRYFGGGGVQVDIRYDYSDTIGQTVAWSETELQAETLGRFQRTIRVQKQKCQSVQVTFSELTGASDTRGWEISDVTFQGTLKPDGRPLLSRSGGLK